MNIKNAFLFVLCCLAITKECSADFGQWFFSAKKFFFRPWFARFQKTAVDKGLSIGALAIAGGIGLWYKYKRPAPRPKEQLLQEPIKVEMEQPIIQAPEVQESQADIESKFVNVGAVLVKIKDPQQLFGLIQDVTLQTMNSKYIVELNEKFAGDFHRFLTLKKTNIKFKPILKFENINALYPLIKNPQKPVVVYADGRFRLGYIQEIITSPLDSKQPFLVAIQYSYWSEKGKGMTNKTVNVLSDHIWTIGN